MKYYSYQKRWKKLGLTSLLERRIKGDLIETLKIIDCVSNYGRYIFLAIFSLQSRLISKNKSTNQLKFSANKVIYFSNKLSIGLIAW